MAPNAPNIAGIWASDAETKSRLQTAPIKDAAPMPKQTRPKATFSATFIDCPRPGNIPLVRAHVAEGHGRLPILLALPRGLESLFRRETANDGYPKLLLAWEKTSWNGGIVGDQNLIGTIVPV